MTTKKTIYIIRHGQTDYNLNGIIQGSGVDSDLNETGRAQALRFYQHYKDEPFDKIYISSLKRTHQSVEPFIRAGKVIETMAELDEINWGKFEGIKSSPPIQQEYFRIVQEWTSGNLDARAGGGESPRELAQRQTRGLQRILSREEERNVLLCMHGRALRSFLCLLLNLPLTEMEGFPHTNLGLYKFEYGYDKGFKMLIRNNTDHLNGIVQRNIR